MFQAYEPELGVETVAGTAGASSATYRSRRIAPCANGSDPSFRPSCGSGVVVLIGSSFVDSNRGGTASNGPRPQTGGGRGRRPGSARRRHADGGSLVRRHQVAVVVLTADRPAVIGVPMARTPTMRLLTIDVLV